MNQPRKLLMVVDAAQIEPVSTFKFPANREKNREFRGIKASAAILTPNRRANPMLCNRIPYATEQGIFKRISGKIFQRTGNLGIWEFSRAMLRL
jgi:hypothetical protein